MFNFFNMVKGYRILYVLAIATAFLFLCASLALGIALSKFFANISMPLDLANQIQRDVQHMPASNNSNMNTAGVGYSYIPQPAPYPSALR